MINMGTLRGTLYDVQLINLGSLAIYSAFDNRFSGSIIYLFVVSVFYYTLHQEKPARLTIQPGPRVCRFCTAERYRPVMCY